MGHMVVEPSPQRGPSGETLQLTLEGNLRFANVSRNHSTQTSIDPKIDPKIDPSSGCWLKDKVFQFGAPKKKYSNLHLSYIQIQRSLETGVRLAPCATLSVCLQVGSGVRAKISKSKGNVMLSHEILTHALQILRKRKKIHKLLYFECSPP